MGAEKIARLFTAAEARRSLFILFRWNAVRTQPCRLGARVALPYRFCGKVETLQGTVISAAHYPDGWLLSIRSDPGTSLSHWGTVYLWISLYASGVLAPWTTNREHKLGYPY